MGISHSLFTAETAEHAEILYILSAGLQYSAVNTVFCLNLPTLSLTIIPVLPATRSERSRTGLTKRAIQPKVIIIQCRKKRKGIGLCGDFVNMGKFKEANSP